MAVISQLSRRDVLLRRSRTARVKRRRGAAAVEMAIVAPLLLALLFGVIDYGWYFYRLVRMNNAVRDAARIATLSENITVDTPALQQHVKTLSGITAPATAVLVSVQTLGTYKVSHIEIPSQPHQKFFFMTPGINAFPKVVAEFRMEYM